MSDCKSVYQSSPSYKAAKNLVHDCDELNPSHWTLSTIYADYEHKGHKDYSKRFQCVHCTRCGGYNYKSSKIDYPERVRCHCVGNSWMAFIS
jgi:hypothetical protein